jgi:hypothetical protein
MKIIYLCFISLISSVVWGQGQFKVRNDGLIQIGYTNYNILTFGQGNGATNNGNFAIEYCSTCPSAGFNFWKPWPTSDYGNYKLFIRDNGNVGIGNVGDASAKLWISGNLKVNSTTFTSDQRFKENIQPINNQLSNLLKLKTYQYTFKQSERFIGDSLSVNANKEYHPDYNFDSNLHYGLMAQDIEMIYPNLVAKDENGYLSLNYTELIPILISSIQEQNERILKLEEELNLLKQR